MHRRAQANRAVFDTRWMAGLTAFCWCVWITPAGDAQTTSITSSGLSTQVQFNASTEVIDGTTFTRNDITGGTRVGANLLHSFGEFNVPAGNIANFLNTPVDGVLPMTANILSRVTGGQTSQIEGILRTTDFGNAALWLLNPAGVLFGPNAALDIGAATVGPRGAGDVHVSTADALSFADGTTFYANPAQDAASNSILTVAALEGFGFWGDPTTFAFTNDHPAAPRTDIRVQGGIGTFGFLAVDPDQTISLVGRDTVVDGTTEAGVSITNSTVSAPGGRVNVASLASAGEVVLSSGPDVQVTATQQGGIAITNATVTTTGDGGGTVVIRGGELMMDGGGVFASVSGPAVGPFTGELGSGIDIEVTGEALFTNSSVLGSNVFTDVAPGIGSGGLRVKADRVEIANFSDLQAIAFGDSRGGSPGDIVVDANNILIRFGSAIRSNTGSDADGGAILLSASDTLEFLDGGTALTIGFFGNSGNVGDIDLHAGRLVINGGNFPGFFFTGLTSQAQASGDGGNISIYTDSFQMLEGFISATPTAGSTGAGGDITVVVAGDAFITGSSPGLFQKGIFTNTFGSGPGGHLSFSADNLELTHRASLEAGSVSSGAAGGADVNIEGNLTVSDGAFINSTTFQGAGLGADLNITATDIVVTGISDSTDPNVSDFTGFSTTAGANQGGNLTIMADNLTVADKAFLQSAASGAGDGGDLTIELTGDLVVMNGGQIFGNAFGSGAAGNISIAADEIALSGVNPVLIVRQDGIETVSPSSISSQSQLGGGQGGEIVISGRALSLLDGGGISAGTFSAADGGNIQITMDESVLISGVNDTLLEFFGPSGRGRAGSGIEVDTSSAFLGADATGNAGFIRIEAAEIRVEEGGFLSSRTTGPGAGGAIELVAKQVTLANEANITATSDFGAAGGPGISTGSAGDIMITASQSFDSDRSAVLSTAEQAEGGSITIRAGQDIVLNNHTRVSAETSGPGDAGSILLEAGNDIEIIHRSAVTAEALDAGGGGIKLSAPNRVLISNSTISTSVQGGVGGNINVDPKQVVCKQCKIIAQAVAGQGGNISITTDLFLADANSLISASSQFGLSGTVTIQSPIQNLSGTLAPMPEAPLQAAVLLRAACAARMQGGETSSFVQRGKGGLPSEPGGWVASPMAASPASAPPPAAGKSGEGKGLHITMSDGAPTVKIRGIGHLGSLTRLLDPDRTLVCSL